MQVLLKCNTLEELCMQQTRERPFATPLPPPPPPTHPRRPRVHTPQIPPHQSDPPPSP
jgi:hypothetical protein